MSQRVSYTLEFLGADKSIQQLEKINSLLANIVRQGGAAGLNGGNVGVGGKGGTTIVATGGGGGAGSAFAGAAIGSGLGGSSGIASQIVSANIKIFDNFRKLATDKTIQNAVDSLLRGGKYKATEIQEWINSLGGGGIKKYMQRVRPLSQTFGNVPMGGTNFAGIRGIVSDIYENLKQKIKFGFKAGGSGTAFDGTSFAGGYSSTHKSTLKESQRWNAIKQMFGGGQASGVGGVPPVIGQGGNFMSGLGALLGTFSKLTLAAIALGVAFETLKVVAHLLSEGIKHGAEAYQNAAKLGRPVSTQFGIENAFKAIGMESPDLAQLQGQFNSKAMKYNAPGQADVILGAARAGQFGNMQQLLNMADEFKEALKDAVNNSRQMELSSKASQVLSMDMTSIMREFKTLLTQTATALYPVLNALLQGAKNFLAIMNIILELWNRAQQLLGRIPVGGEFGRHFGGNATTNTTAWEKLGFVFKTPSLDTNKAIERNTNRIANGVDNIIARLAGFQLGLGAVARATIPMLP